MMKILITLLIGLLSITMNGQAKKTTEIHTRPISLLQGVGTVGLELQTSDKTSILFDGGYGRSLLDAPGNTVTTFMVGTRLYLSPKGDEESIRGSYITARHRSRFYNSGSYGANTNMMFGKKWLINDRMSLAAEFGVGRQTIRQDIGNTIGAILPTWAVTIGLRSK